MLDLLKSPFVGVHELRQNLPRLLERIRAEGVDLVVTHQGKPAAVLMDVKKYLELQETLRDFSDPEYVRSILAARQEIREGRGMPLTDALDALKDKE